MGQNRKQLQRFKSKTRWEISKTEIEGHDLFSLKNKVLGPFKSCGLMSDHYPQLFTVSEWGNLQAEAVLLYIFTYDSFGS